MVFDDAWVFLVVIGGSWCGFWQVFVIIGGSWIFLVVRGGFW